MYIYALAKNQPVTVNIPDAESQIVVTDGFHITKPMKIVFRANRLYHFQVTCAILDDQLMVALLITSVLYGMGASSGMVLLQLLSLGPIFYILFLYYINRKEFIRLQTADEE